MLLIAIYQRGSVLSNKQKYLPKKSTKETATFLCILALYHIIDICRFITEEGHKSNTSICRQHGQKEQHVYTSNGRNVVIELSKRTGTSEFLLSFKGR